MRLLLFILLPISLGLHVQAQQKGTIGAEVEIFELRDNDEVVQFVSLVHQGSAAAKAGIRAGDILLSVDGSKYNGDIGGLVHKLSGKLGTTVTLIIERFGETKRFPVTRQLIPGKPVVFNKAQIPAFKSIRNVDISNFYSTINKCLAGDCKNGKGIFMREDSILVLATNKNGKANGLMQLRGPQHYVEINLLNDSREGNSYTYYDGGKIDMVPYKNDKEDGIGIVKTADGGEYEYVYKDGKEISMRRTKASEVRIKPGEKPTLEQERYLALKALEPEAERARKAVTKNGGKVVVDRTFYLSSSFYTPALFPATADVKGYHIFVISAKGSGKAEGYFNYTTAENFYFKEDTEGNTNVLHLKIGTYPGKFGSIHLKSSNEKTVPAWVLVGSY